MAHDSASYPGSALGPLPVAWSAEREARGAIGTRRDAYRCPERECPVASADLRAMVAHVRAHREAEAADVDPRARALDGVRDAGRRWPGPCWTEELDTRPWERVPKPSPEPEPPAHVPPNGTTVPPWVRYPGMRRPAVTAHAGLASAAGTAPQPVPAVNARPCACGCSELIVPGPWQQQRRFATDQCRKRVQRRDERARLRELTAAAEPSDRSELPVTSAAAVTSAARCLATVA